MPTEIEKKKKEDSLVYSCANLDSAKVYEEYVVNLKNLTCLDDDYWTKTKNNDSVINDLPFDQGLVLLLQNQRSKKGTLTRKNLLRLSRLFLAVYFDSNDDEDVQSPSITNVESYPPYVI